MIMSYIAYIKDFLSYHNTNEVDRSPFVLCLSCLNHKYNNAFDSCPLDDGKNYDGIYAEVSSSMAYYYHDYDRCDGSLPTAVYNTCDIVHKSIHVLKLCRLPLLYNNLEPEVSNILVASLTVYLLSTYHQIQSYTQTLYRILLVCLLLSSFRQLYGSAIIKR